MVVDGATVAELEEVLHNDMQATLHRVRRSAASFAGPPTTRRRWA